jgi:hypothetical protein
MRLVQSQGEVKPMTQNPKYACPSMADDDDDDE